MYNGRYTVMYFFTKGRNISAQKKNCITIKALEVSHISWRGKIVSTENKLAAQSRLLLEKI
jgi:hypothetical protein